MQKSDLDHRVTVQASMSTTLSFLKDAEVQQLIRPIKGPQPSWGSNGVIKVAGRKVFVKRIPMTDAEITNPFSTRNHFQLPMYYSYGIGSAGLGVWREIASTIQASNWVVGGERPNFPLLYHYRILTRQRRQKKLEHSVYDDYIGYWNSSARIRRFIESRHTAMHEAVLFLEYLPHTLRFWLVNHLDQASRVHRQMLELTDFIRSKDVVHFDCHHSNVLTDGGDLYLTDFGLALDSKFDLADRERQFLLRNTYCDIGTFVFRSSEYLIEVYRLSAKRKRASIRMYLGVDQEPDQLQFESLLLENLEELVHKELLSLDQDFVRDLVKWREASLLMSQFYADLMADPRKRVRLDNNHLKRLVSAATSR